MSVQFPNIRAFQDYFSSYDTLEIPQEQHLRIQNMQAVMHIRKGELEVDDPTYGNATISLMCLLNKLITPIGKTVGFTLPEQEVTYQIEDELDAVFPRGAVITAEKAVKIYTRASEFFRVMVISSRMTFNLEVGQVLNFIGLTEEACKGENQLQRFLTANPLPGFERASRLKKVKFNSGKIEFMGTVQNCICLREMEAQGGVVEFSFSESPDHTYWEGSFIDRMLLHPRIGVAAGQVLKIHGEFIRHIGTLLQGELSEMSPCSFALNQLFLPFGRKILISDSRFTYKDDTIEIFSDTGFTIELTEIDHCFIDLRVLGRRMIENRCTHLTIPANQKAIFYGISSKERQKI
ncbi:MAG: hypothetical protein JSS12_11855, partial [Verrucomicrobia bacterium]|nr:hypothetical protein [Verrucomicrobiota bacterium]